MQPSLNFNHEIHAMRQLPDLGVELHIGHEQSFELLAFPKSGYQLSTTQSSWTI